MKPLRIGTRGSALALKQVEIVVDLLRKADPTMIHEVVIINTHADVHQDQPIDEDWPIGGFTSAIEDELLSGRVDLAVHSCKDLPTEMPRGLVIAAIPQREEPGDVVISREPFQIDRIPPGWRIGTSSSRRAAQIRQLGAVEIVSIRGNVPTRIAKLKEHPEDFDAIVLAAAGLHRLGLNPAHRVDLPLERFPTSPGQGALAVQTRDCGEARDLASRSNHGNAFCEVLTERAILREVGGGCGTPLAATARCLDGGIHVHAQLFDRDGIMSEVRMMGDEPQSLGCRVAKALTLRNR